MRCHSNFKRKKKEMKYENLKHYEPNGEQLARFHRTNAWDNDFWNKKCCLINDCSICPMAIHHHLISTIKHTCVRGMSEEKFYAAMDNADVDF